MPWLLPSSLTLIPTHLLALVFHLLLQAGSLLCALSVLFPVLGTLFPQLIRAGSFSLLVWVSAQALLRLTVPYPYPAFSITWSVSFPPIVLVPMSPSLDRHLPRAACDCRVHCGDPSAGNSTRH